VRVQQIKLKVTGLRAIGKKGDARAIGRELGQTVDIGPECQDTRVPACDVCRADTRRKAALEPLQQRAGEGDAAAVRREAHLHCIAELARAGLAQCAHQGLGFLEQQ